MGKRSLSLKKVFICLFIVLTAFCVIMTLATTDNKRASADAEKILDLYVIAGQSNGLGYNKISTVSDANKQTYDIDYSAYKIKYSGLHQARYTSYNSITFRDVDLAFGLGNDTGKIGPEIGIGSIIKENYNGHESLILKRAWGGTALFNVNRPNEGNWCSPSSCKAGDDGYIDNMTGLLYRELISLIGDTVSAYSSNGYSVRLCGTFWMQGEDEMSSSERSSAYAYLLKNLINDYRTDIGKISNLSNATSAPFVIGLISPSFGGDRASSGMIIAAQRYVAQSMSDKNVFVTQNTYDLFDPVTGELIGSDEYHFNGNDEISLGREAGSLMNVGSEVKYTVTVKNDSAMGTVNLTPYKSSYANNENVSFTVVPRGGYSVNSVTFNGATLSAANGVYDITIGSTNVISVTYNDLTASTGVGAYNCTASQFDMLGISIRYADASSSNGIRFGVRLEKSIYNTLIADSNAVAGILIAPEDQIKDGNGDKSSELNLWGVANSKAVYGILYAGSSVGNQNNWVVDDNYATGIVYLHGFPSSSFNRPIAARAFIDWNNDSSAATTYYTAQVKKSMSDVALAVRKDYEDSNSYGTSAAHYSALGAYLLKYDVNFIDAYGNWMTRTYQYGTPVYYEPTPRERTGYVFDGWQLKTGESTYAAASAIAESAVKYSKTYRAAFHTTGSTFDNPVLESSSLYSSTNTFRQNYTQATINYNGTGVTFIKGAEIAQDQDFVIYTTVQKDFCDCIGFVVGTLEDSKHVLFTFRPNDITVWRTISGDWKGHDDNLYTPGFGSNTTAKTIALVYHDGYYYMFLNGVQVFKQLETTNLGWGMVPKTYIGTSGTKKIGFACSSGVFNLSSWGYSTDSEVIAEYVGSSLIAKPALLDSGLYSSYNTFNVTSDSAQINYNGNGAVFFDGAEIAQGQDFVIYATVNSGFCNSIGFVVGTLYNGSSADNSKHLMIQFRPNDMVFWRTSGGNWAGHDDNLYTPGYGNNSSAKNIALVYKGGQYYLFLDGVQKLSVSESTNLGWGMVPKNYVGTSGSKKIGLSCSSGAFNLSDWGYSIDSAVIDGYLAGSRPALVDSGLYSSYNTFNVTSDSAQINYNGNGAVFFDGAEIAQGQDFVIYATVNSGFCNSIGFVVGTLYNGSSADNSKHLMIQFRPNDMVFWRTSGGNWAGHDDNLYTPGYGNNSSAKNIALVYKGGQYYLFLDGVQKLSVSESTNLGWGMVPKNYVGTSGSKKIGLSCSSGTFNLSDWGYSTDSAEIAKYVSD